MFGLKKLFLLICLSFISYEVFSVNFTRGAETAQKFGVHEITLTGDGTVPNPFDTPCEVTFTPPSGSSGSVTVDAFYDGDNSWHARCYVTETGNWSWRSTSSIDAGLDNKAGAFSAVDSELRGKLKRHPENAKALATDNGKWFLNIGDTPYLLFHEDHDKWKEFIRDDWNLGISLVRAQMIGGGGDRFFENADHNKLNTSNFQTDDSRLIWMLDHYPGMYIEFIVFGGCNTGYMGDETWWHGLTGEQRNRILKYVVARYAAFPEIIWEIVNDYKYSSLHPNNVAMANEAGGYFKDNDPWHHLITTGGVRGDDFYFRYNGWASFFHLETLDALPADQAKEYRRYSVHVFDGEDRYERYKQPDHPKIYFRRLIWAWTLSGGSACYAGYHDKIIPYSQTPFEGLNNIIHVKNFFEDNKIDLSGYISDDYCVSSGATGTKRPKVMRTQSKSAYVIYHPNAGMDSQGANISFDTASLTINDLSAGAYTVLWMRANNGLTQEMYFNHNGGDKFLISPWPGIDVVIYLRADPVVGMKALAGNLPDYDDDILSVKPDPFGTSVAIVIRLPEDVPVCMDIFNIQGKHVERLAHGKINRGEHQFTWNAKNSPDGMYFVKLISGNRAYSRKISLVN